MSRYTTGELAKACGVTVRTVQFYDQRGILFPSALTEGGRRLYSEDDLQKMKIICFLRDIGLSLDTIRQLLKEEDPGSVIFTLLQQQEHALTDEIAQRREKLDRLEELERSLRQASVFSLETIGDIASIMENKKKLHALRKSIIMPGIGFGILQWSSVFLWIFRGIWQPFALWAIAVVPFAVWAVRRYYRNTVFVCPKCHAVFRPVFREFFLSRHTRITRRLTCTACGHCGFSVETWGGDVK